VFEVWWDYWKFTADECVSERSFLIVFDEENLLANFLLNHFLTVGTFVLSLASIG